MDISLELPAEARTYFDETATALLSTLKPCKPRKAAVPLKGSLGERPIVFKADSSNIIGTVDVTFINGFDEFCGFEVHGDNVHEAIMGEDAQKLDKLSAKLANRRELKPYCGTAYVRAHLINWIRHRRLGTVAETSWISIFLPALQNAVIDHISIIPLEGIEISIPFDLGGIHFDYFNKQQFDHMFTANQPPDGMKDYVEKLRKQFQGRVYAGFRCRAVREHADKLAFYQTDRVLEVVRMFDAAAFEIRAQCIVGRFGQVSPNLTCVFHQSDVGDLFLSQGTGSPVRKNLVINEALLHRMRETGIAIAWELIQKDKLTDLEERALEAVSHFAHGVAATDAQDRLLHALIAVESLLLRNSNEPVLGKIGQRLAVLTKPSLEKRKQAISDFSAGYSLRSAFVHHGVKPDDIQMANRVLLLCWDTINCAMYATRKFDTKNVLLNWLDDQLLAP
jgi:hypothetical protein